MQNLLKLQAWLKDNQLQGLLIPSADEFQNEYVPDSARRLLWATEFDGSAGKALILQDRAALFVDGRYTTQARMQTDSNKIEVLDHKPESFSSWLKQHLEENNRIAVDPKLHTLAEVKKMRELMENSRAKVYELSDNPIDELWEQRPATPATEVYHYPLKYTGTDCFTKRQAIAAELEKSDLDAYLITAPEELAWLLNIRASDLETIPISLSYALLKKDSSLVWFVRGECVKQLQLPQLGEGVEVEPLQNVLSYLDQYFARQDGKRQTVGLNLKRTPYHLIKVLESKAAYRDKNFIEAAKACKNTAELTGAKAAQQIDCLALIRFFAWLQQEAENVTELGAAQKVTEFRSQHDAFKAVSFPPISASGAHSALAHYGVNEQTDIPLKDHPIYLLDSGGQYFGGTTDLTRTVALGKPSDEHRRAYTLVLKGHIALAMAKFPQGTSGSQLDVLARQFLWQEGMDYGHGTGHGVGSYLSVHEGPASISPRPNSVALKEGMILSNEPGYYKEGSFGIRIENLVRVKKSNLAGFLEFETLSFVPLDSQLVDFSLLTAEEKGWLQRYHEKIVDGFMEKLSASEATISAEICRGFSVIPTFYFLCLIF